MKLSIVSVNFRSFGFLEKALAALAPDFPGDWEVIVVDNASIAEDLEAFSHRFPWVRFIPNPANSGFGHGCNIGAAAASGDRLLFMNPDVVASCASIQALATLQDTHDVGIIAPSQVTAGGEQQKVSDDFPSLWNLSKTVKAVLRWVLPASMHGPRAATDGLMDCDWVTGAVLMIGRDNFDALGGWTEDYWMYAEDADLCRKAHNAGLRVAWSPDIEVVHAHGGSSRLNVEVKAMTKSEVIISKHVYAKNHQRGFARTVTHTLIILLRMPALLLAELLNLVSLGLVPALRVRSRMCGNMLGYYGGVLRSGSWLSPRALANQTAREDSEKTTQ